MLWSDASAAIGIARRKGLGKVRHLDVGDLWIQDKLRSKDLDLKKVAGVVNPADMLTKYVDRNTYVKHIARINMTFQGGRAQSAPQLSDVQKSAPISTPEQDKEAGKMAAGKMAIDATATTPSATHSTTARKSK